MIKNFGELASLPTNMRLLPRLVAALARDSAASAQFTRIPRRVTRKAPPATVRPRKPLSFQHNGRTRSILLDNSDWVTRANDWARNVKTAKKRLRDISEREAEWESSPYRILRPLVTNFLVNVNSVRMLASPIRKCSFTQRLLPSGTMLLMHQGSCLTFLVDFLIRLSYTESPAPEWAGTVADETATSATRSKAAGSLLLVPDGLQHPNYASRRSGYGLYGLCSAQVFQLYASSPTSTFPQIARNSYPLMQEHIQHLLRIRVLQELNVLFNAIVSSPTTAEDTVLRRLTRGELAYIRSFKKIPENILNKGVVALIIAPRPNRDPNTKLRPSADMSASLPPESLVPNKLPTPPCILMSASGSAVDPGLPQRLPVYISAAMFSYPGHRIILHSILSKISGKELNSKRNFGGREVVSQDSDQRPSDAFLLQSNGRVLRRGIDPVPLAIALWRHKIWSTDLLNEYKSFNGWAQTV